MDYDYDDAEDLYDECKDEFEDYDNAQDYLIDMEEIHEEKDDDINESEEDD